MLIDRQYDCAVDEPGMKPELDNINTPALLYIDSGITLPYFMSILRYPGNLSPEEGRMSIYL
jgi:hypothetical protein